MASQFDSTYIYLASYETLMLHSGEIKPVLAPELSRAELTQTPEVKLPSSPMVCSVKHSNVFLNFVQQT